MIQCVVCEDWYHGRHTGRGDSGPPDDRWGDGGGGVYSVYTYFVSLVCMLR